MRFQQIMMGALVTIAGLIAYNWVNRLFPSLTSPPAGVPKVF